MTVISPTAKSRVARRWWASIRAKITLPYVILAILLALGAAFVATRFLVDTVQERFVKQLLESGRLVADRIAGIEQESLAVLRAVAHTAGLAEAVEQGKTAEVEALAFPLVVNGGAEVVEIVNREGTTLLSLHCPYGGNPADCDRTIVPVDWRQFPFVANALNGVSDASGDKFAGLATIPQWGYTFYIAGPIYRDNTLVGAILVGRSLKDLPIELRAVSGAQQVTLYGLDGTPLASSFPLSDLEPLRMNPEQAGLVLAEQDRAVLPRTIPWHGSNYSEVAGPLEVRHGTDIGLFGAALAQSYLVQASPITQVQLIILVAAALLAIVATGTFVSQLISSPILEVARVSRRVASGDLDQRVSVRTRDEVQDLAEAFNKMLTDLKQAQRVRDIFGRAVSREVSQLLISAADKGEVSLTGEVRVVTTMFTDIRDFTAQAEGRPPSEVLAMLNEVLGTFVEVISKHDGVVNKFGGDSLLSIFGAPILQPDHARRAVLAGLEMIDRLAELNEQRQARGLPTIEAGIGLNTGEVVAGLTGSAERLEYTVIGDTVNTTARIQGLCRQFGGTSLLVTAATLEALGTDHGLQVEDLGATSLRGKAEAVQVYRVYRGD